ncbi:MAG: VIT and VWA domain-containing protein [Planctomycetota bacterium]|nr:VIT and VWA domain-containing protein [Planctomycetota bacterium]
MSSQDVSVRIYNHLAITTVTQTVLNQGEKDAPCSLDFAVPPGARANSFSAVVDGKSYRGVIRKKYVARQIVEDAKEDKKAAALVEERGNSLHVEFSQIKAGQEFSLTFSYMQENTYSEGYFNYFFGVKRTAKQMQRQGYLTMKVVFDCTAEIAEVLSTSHDLAGGLNGKTAAFTVENIEADAKMFELEYALKLEPGVPHVLVKDVKGEDPYFSLLALPPDAPVMEQGRSIALILDKSGSMQGQKYADATNALKTLISGLRPNDLINVFIFDTETYAASPLPFLADDKGKKAALSFIDKYKANGGTRFLESLSSAIKGLMMDPNHVPAVVLLTDGHDNVDGPKQFVRRLEAECEFRVPIFTFAIGADLNFALLRTLAGFSGAEMSKIVRPADIDNALKTIKARMDNIVGRTLKVTTANNSGYQKYPLKQAYVYKDTPIVVYGRLDDEKKVKLTLASDTAGGEWVQTLDISTEGERNDCPFLDQQWASKRMQALVDQVTIYGETPELKREILRSSERYFITSPWISFVFSEEGEKPNDEYEEPLEEPTEGMRSFGRGGKRASRSKSRSNAAPQSTGGPAPPGGKPLTDSEDSIKEEKKAVKLPAADDVPANAMLLAFTANNYSRSKAVADHAFGKLMEKLADGVFSSDFFINVAAVSGVCALPEDARKGAAPGTLAAKLFAAYKDGMFDSYSDEKLALTAIFLSRVADAGHKLPDALKAELKKELVGAMGVDVSAMPIGKNVDYLAKWIEWFPIAYVAGETFGIAVPEGEQALAMLDLVAKYNSQRARLAKPDFAFITALSMLRGVGLSKDSRDKLDRSVRAELGVRPLKDTEKSLVGDYLPKALWYMAVQ